MALTQFVLKVCGLFFHCLGKHQGWAFHTHYATGDLLQNGDRPQTSCPSFHSVVQLDHYSASSLLPSGVPVTDTTIANAQLQYLNLLFDFSHIRFVTFYRNERSLSHTSKVDSTASATSSK